MITPLLHGVTSIVDSNEFDAERWYRILEEQAVTVWYTAPTAIRMLMKSGPELAHKYSYPHLRLIASVGEPLNPTPFCGDETCSVGPSTTTGGKPKRAAS